MCSDHLNGRLVPLQSDLETLTITDHCIHIRESRTLHHDCQCSQLQRSNLLDSYASLQHNVLQCQVNKCLITCDAMTWLQCCYSLLINYLVKGRHPHAKSLTIQTSIHHICCCLTGLACIVCVPSRNGQAMCSYHHLAAKLADKLR